MCAGLPHGFLSLIDQLQNELARTMHELDDACEVKVYGSVENAVDYARTLAARSRTATLATGSLHLVGGALFYLAQGLEGEA